MDDVVVRHISFQCPMLCLPPIYYFLFQLVLGISVLVSPDLPIYLSLALSFLSLSSKVHCLLITITTYILVTSSCKHVKSVCVCELVLTVFPWILPPGTINFRMCQDAGTERGRELFKGGNYMYLYFIGVHVKSTRDWALYFFTWLLSIHVSYCSSGNFRL